MKKLFNFLVILSVGMLTGIILTHNNFSKKTEKTATSSVVTTELIEKTKDFGIVKTTKYDLISVSVDTVPKEFVYS
jgi:hypothetical protein